MGASLFRLCGRLQAAGCLVAIRPWGPEAPGDRSGTRALLLGAECERDSGDEDDQRDTDDSPKQLRTC